MSISLFDAYPLGVRPTSSTQSSVGTVNSTVSSYVTASHKVIGGILCRTTLTLASLPQTVVNGTEYQGTKLFTFPQGLIRVINSSISLAQKTTSDPATTLNASSTGAMSLGSTTAASTTLNSTAANFLPSTAFTSSATQNVAGSTVTAELDANDDYSEEFKLDGTTTAVALYFNSAFATTTDVDADATQTFSGTITIEWELLSFVQSIT